MLVLLVLEVVLYAAVMGFGCAYGMRLLDYLMDYKQRLWKIRYNKAVKSALRVGYEAKLDSALLDAEKGNDGVNTMASVYAELSKMDEDFKLWICVYCMSIRLNLILGVVITGLLIWLGIAPIFAVIFFALSFCFNSLFLGL